MQGKERADGEGSILAAGFGMIQDHRGLQPDSEEVPPYLYGRRNLVTLERSSLMKERGNISLDSCAVYLK